MQQIPFGEHKSLQYDDAVFERHIDVGVVEIRIIVKRSLDAQPASLIRRRLGD
jgi:hypothetical protein